MNVRFATKALESLATELGFLSSLPADVVRQYRKRVQMILGAEDERDFYQLKSLHFEKLKGDRDHQRSMRLNDQWRLVLEIENCTPKNTIVVVSVEDYH